MSLTKSNASALLSESLETYYWAGFIAADGSIIDNKRLHLGLSIKDKNHLLKLAKFLSCKKRSHTMKPRDDEGTQSISFNPYAEFELDTYHALLKNRIILYNDEINKSVIERIVLPIASLSKKSARPITLLINSPGGSVEDGQMVVDAILTSRAPIITVAMGKAMSAAFDIFIAGDKRIVYPNTILMMHSGSSRFETQTLPQINVEADLHHRYFERWSKWYASRTKIEQKEWHKMLSTGLNYYYFPEEGRKLGLVHEIIRPGNKISILRKKLKI